jgi:choline dehydrogenase-like flavoprotein
MSVGERYDAVIVGSGAGGGMAALVLASKGLRVLMLEAGRHYDPYKETQMLAPNRNAPLRGEGTPDKEFGFFDATVDGGWQVPGEPYSSAPGSKFMWWRSRMLGGHQSLGAQFLPHNRTISSGRGTGRVDCDRTKTLRRGTTGRRRWSACTAATTASRTIRTPRPASCTIRRLPASANCSFRRRAAT